MKTDRFFKVVLSCVVALFLAISAQASTTSKVLKAPVKKVGKSYRPLYRHKKVKFTRKVNRRQIVNLAERNLGTPYHFGGKSDRGTDCSGFTQFVYKKGGVELPHTTVGQAEYGRLVESSNELQTADLVFFETYKKGPSHVGLYIGKGEFIHASTGKGIVMKSKISEPYFKNRFLGGKRLF